MFKNQQSRTQQYQKNAHVLLGAQTYNQGMGGICLNDKQKLYRYYTDLEIFDYYMLKTKIGI